MACLFIDFISKPSAHVPGGLNLAAMNLTLCRQTRTETINHWMYVGYCWISTPCCIKIHPSTSFWHCRYKICGPHIILFRSIVHQRKEDGLH